MSYLYGPREHTINGVKGTLSEVIYSFHDGHVMQQVWRAYRIDEHGNIAEVKLRFDDDCKNGYLSFDITGTFRRYDGGRITDKIAKLFPELAHLIKWQLCSTGGPMHYIENTIYWVRNGNLDYARNNAIWLDATKKDLMIAEGALIRKLKIRLPLLLAQFRMTMANCGFVERKEVKKIDKKA